MKKAETDTLEKASPPIPKETRHKFTPEEDDLLIKLVQKYGACHWKSIAKNMVNRSARQCRDRYANYLSHPNVMPNWTDEEDQKLLSLYHEFGPVWVKMPDYFNGRTAANIRNRFLKIQRSKRKKLTNAVYTMHPFSPSPLIHEPSSPECDHNGLPPCADIRYFIN